MAYAVGIFLASVVQKRYPKAISSMWYETVVGSLLMFTGGVYGAARLFIMVEPFISLRYAPAGIYEKVTWPSYWPHIGA